MDITGTNPSGEDIGIRIIDTARLTFSLRTLDVAGTAGDRYVAPRESSFTDALCKVLEESPRASPLSFHVREGPSSQGEKGDILLFCLAKRGSKSLRWKLVRFLA